MQEVFIVDGLRTPIGKTNGILKDFLPEKLGALVLNELLRRNALKSFDVDKVVLGNVVGTGGNIARVSMLEARWDFSVPAISIDSQCGSALESINIAQNMIIANDADIIFAGGIESTSMAPKRQFNKSDPRFVNKEHYYEQAPFSPLSIGNPDVIEAAGNVAEICDIKRSDMDKWALCSHEKAVMAQDLLQDIILPIKNKEDILINYDECIRKNINTKFLSRLPDFNNSGITAGNTSLKHDGAAVIVLASKKALGKFNLKPIAKIRKIVAVGSDPNVFPLSPVLAIKKVLSVEKLTIDDVFSFEINEAFSAKILACCKKLELPLEKVNLFGGALAYGHPYGASGAIILLHLLQGLRKYNARYGVVAIGAVGGLGTAGLIERL